MIIFYRSITLSLLLMIAISNVQAQEIIINIAGMEGSVKLYSLEGERTFLIDSINTENGKVQILTNKYDMHTGIYKIIIGINTWIDFIYDGDDIELTADLNNVAESVDVIKSKSNKLFHEFIKLNKAYKTKTEMLQLILSRYPNDDDYLPATQSQLNKIQNNYLDFVSIKSQGNKNSFVARYIKSAQLPVIRIDMNPENQISYLQSNSLNNVDFNDAELIYSDLFTNKSIEYLMYYRNPQLTKEFLEKEFMRAVDTLLNKAKVNELVYLHITEYLISGFRKFGFDNIIDYIIDNYVVKDELCLDEKLESSILNRMNQSKIFAVGSTVPNIELPNTSGTIVNLANIKTENTLLIFYASWCPHCRTILPEINQIYNEQSEKKLEVIAISLDEDRNDWLEFVKKNCLNFINVSDNLGWDGEVSSSYYIYATPTMFLLDSNKNIIGKPLKTAELKELLNW